jgi:hypothetical protein
MASNFLMILIFVGVLTISNTAFSEPGDRAVDFYLNDRLIGQKIEHCALLSSIASSTATSEAFSKAGHESVKNSKLAKVCIDEARRELVEDYANIKKYAGESERRNSILKIRNIQILDIINYIELHNAERNMPEVAVQTFDRLRLHWEATFDSCD